LLSVIDFLVYRSFADGERLRSFVDGGRLRVAARHGGYSPFYSEKES
jgi:hypothetical protein